MNYLRMKILRKNPRYLESTIQVAMRKQNLRQRLAIRGSKVTESVQNNDNGRTLSRFDTTPPFFKNNLDNFAPAKKKAWRTYGN